MYDTETNKEWLGLVETQAMSIDDVVTLLETDFKGWRLPTYQEVNALVNSVFTNIEIDVESTERQMFNQPDLIAEDIQLFAEMFVSSENSPSRRVGLVMAPDGSVFTTGYRTDYWSNELQVNRDGLRTDQYKANYGVWLVADGTTTLTGKAANGINDVSIPAVAGIGMMMLGFAGFRRKAK